MRKVSIFIGRFQPFHMGHYAIVKSALEQTDFLVMVLGSHKKSINTRDPLTTHQRIDIIKRSLSQEQLERIRFVKVEDYEYNLDKWIASVNTAIANANLPWHSGPTSYYLAGMMKDHSSFYLNLFPNYKSIICETDENNTLSSTFIRKMWYEGEQGLYDAFVSTEAYNLFDVYIEQNDKKYSLKYEYNFEQEYPGKWGKGPHLTVDSCVVQAGHVLLIQRGKEYGHNKWALPGGFVNPYETTLDASLRELDEETQIKLPMKILRGSLVSSKLYDSPYRSNRGRVVTNAFQYRLSDVGPLPKVVGSDDAKDAQFVPISKFLTMQDEMFEDHYSMICDILKL
jgi:bifunctional NMN adenylyltransferase/nudix hydrolase